MQITCQERKTAKINDFTVDPPCTRQADSRNHASMPQRLRRGVALIRITIAKTVSYQEKGNVILFPSPCSEGVADNPIECHEWRGETLKYDERQAT